MLTDDNHKLECAIRFMVTRQMDRRIRQEAHAVKRRTTSEWIRQVIEEKLGDLDRARSVP